MPDESPVHETRIALTVQDYDAAVRFYRDVLGLPLVEEWNDPSGSGVVLDAGRATIEVLSPGQAELVERIETGGGRPEHVRLALDVDDSASMADALESAGAQRLGGPVVTPWSHRNVRLRTPDGLQLTLFTVIEPQDG